MERTEQRYNTQALQHYWAFKWLDKTGLGSAWIGLVYLVFIVGFFHILESSMEGSNQFRPEIKWILSTYGVGFLTLWLVLARGAQRDYVQICHYAGSGLPSFSQATQAIRRVRILELIIGIGLGYSMSFIGRALTLNESLISAFLSPAQDFSISMISGLYSLSIALVFIFSGICAVRMVTFLYRQIHLFHHAAQSISLDLLNPGPLAAFANQSIRALLGTAIISTMIPLSLSASIEVSRTLIPIGLPSIFLMLVLLIFVSIPLWRIRNRLKQAKIVELDTIQRALRGDREALNDSRIAASMDEFRLPDLLYYEDRIRAVWEWPLHMHIRRIAFYIILPPLAWILAAIVETLVDTALQ